MRTGPCQPWPLDPTCCYGIAVDPAQRTPVTTGAVEGASELLWRLTGGVFGLCDMTVRPCRAECAPVITRPELVGGVWLNIGCGCTGGCGCGPLCVVRLPGPVNSITEVRTDGTVMDPAAYRVDDGSTLVRLDGGCWPACQDMSADSATDPGTWQVRYLQGLEVPAGGRRAVGAVAAELVRACSNQPCRLPANATTVSREGVTIQIDTTGLLDAGRTGLPEVDMWLAAVNPNGLRQRSTVYSPDIAAITQTTWPITPTAAVAPLQPHELAHADKTLT